jgi:hypothetical protein
MGFRQVDTPEYDWPNESNWERLPICAPDRGNGGNALGPTDGLLYERIQRAP